MSASTALQSDLVASLCREMNVGWTDADLLELERELAPYTAAIHDHMRTGEKIPSHIEGTGSVCVPITSITDPHEMFAQAAGSVAKEKYAVREYDTYWITTHFSTVPVVILLLKEAVALLPKYSDLCSRCSRDVGAAVGGETGGYFQFNLPRFAWTLHTDDEYEGVASRVHLPFWTNPSNRFAWADQVDTAREHWLLDTYLERGRLYQIRTDIPHTAINQHESDGRLHLILDVAAAAGN